MIVVFSIVSILVFIAVVYFFDVTVREWMAASKARKRATALNKPLLNIGAGTTGSCLTGPKLRGDVNCDLAAPRHIAHGPHEVSY